MKRRKFVKRTLAGAAVAGSYSAFGAPAVLRSLRSPGETLHLGVVGCNNMGWSNIRSHLEMADVDCIAICDVDQEVIAKRVADYGEMRENAVETYTDYRRLLENQDIDAVIIGTPDHWHCRIMVDALQAGKHVYVEKPLANSIQECYIMERAAEQSGKVVQVGQWQRSGEHYAHAIDLVRSGTLGKIRLVRTWAYMGWMDPVPVLPDTEAPPHVDYKMWLGPASLRPFNKNRFHFNFRWFWDYAGGLMTDWGVHEIDIALYAMQVRAPRSVMASGGKLAYPDDAAETPDTLQTVYEFDGFNLLWEHAVGIDSGNYGRNEGIAFIGDNGTLILNRDGFEVIPETDRQDKGAQPRMTPVPREKRSGSYLDAHTANFVAAIRDNNPAAAKCTPYSGSVAAVNAHMGNIAYKLGRKIYWDNENGLFDDDDANAMITPVYHNGWELPE